MKQKLDNAALEESLMWLKKVYKMYIFTKYQFVQFLMFGAQKEGNQFPKVFWRPRWKRPSWIRHSKTSFHDDDMCFLWNYSFHILYESTNDSLKVWSFNVLQIEVVYHFWYHISSFQYSSYLWYRNEKYELARLINHIIAQ